MLKSDSTMADLEHAVKTRWPRNDVVPKLIRVTTIRRDERGQPIPETLAPQVTPVEIIPPKNQNALSTAQRQFLQSRSSSKEDWITRVIATREPLDQNLFDGRCFRY